MTSNMTKCATFIIHIIHNQGCLLYVTFSLPWQPFRGTSVSGRAVCSSSVEV